MIAPKNQRQSPLSDAIFNQLSQMIADLHNFSQKLTMGFPVGLGFRNCDGYVANVFNGVPQRCHSPVQVGDPDGTGAHVNSSPAAALIKRPSNPAHGSHKHSVKPSTGGGFCGIALSRVRVPSPRSNPLLVQSP